MTDNIEAIRRRHALGLNHDGNEECHHCRESWPCQTIQAVIAYQRLLDEARAEQTPCEEHRGLTRRFTGCPYCVGNEVIELRKALTAFHKIVPYDGILGDRLKEVQERTRKLL